MNKKTHNAQYTICAQRFDNDQTIFLLKNFYSKEIIEKTAYAIFLESHILKSLNSEDAYLVGYVSACEKIFSEDYFSFVPLV